MDYSSTQIYVFYVDNKLHLFFISCIFGPL